LVVLGLICGWRIDVADKLFFNLIDLDDRLIGGLDRIDHNLRVNLASKFDLRLQVSDVAVAGVQFVKFEEFLLEFVNFGA
jgi:hypothetical protein